ncbi:unnamed protein product [Onchocerca flexuosa]|uniref:Uncharacterized protein n=1 Tax=Onchocerca flexuosa TaxID=387005 RepID=A0A183HXX5_9BILA|nr:unnamed protein product [Onchocerca flexuosa]
MFTQSEINERKMLIAVCFRDQSGCLANATLRMDGQSRREGNGRSSLSWIQDSLPLDGRVYARRQVPILLE